KSGTTGAGRGVKVDQLFAEVNENFRPYAIGEHRHGPEIDQELRAAGAARGALFVPHLLPLSRGLLCTMYVRTGGARPRLAELFQGAYDGEPFVVLRGEDAPPELRDVRGTNRCAIGWRWGGASGQAIVVTASPRPTLAAKLVTRVPAAARGTASNIMMRLAAGKASFRWRSTRLSCVSTPLRRRSLIWRRSIP